MPGHLEKRSAKSWTIVIELGRDPATGKRKRLKKAFRGTKKEAEKELARLLTEIEKGTYVEPAKISFGEYLLRWLDHSEQNLAPRTLHRYRQIVTKDIIPELGQVPLSKLKPLHLQDFYTKMLQRLSPTTVLQYHRIIHRALELAVKWQLVPRNVADAVEPPRKVKKELNVLDTTQVAYMLEKAKETPYYPHLVLAVFTGMRRGEIYGLRWQDIDFEAGTITVSQAAQYVPGNGISFKPPKNNKARVIDVPDIVLDVLRQVKAQQNKQRLAAGKNYLNTENLVFTNPDGSRQHPDSISSWFPKFMKSIGLPPIRFHDLRHTHASLLANEGADLKLVSARLGHSSVAFTSDIYVHLFPSKQKTVANQLEETIKSFGHQLGTKTKI